MLHLATPAAVTYSTPLPANDLSSAILLEEISAEIRSIQRPMATSSKVIDLTTSPRSSPDSIQHAQTVTRTSQLAKVKGARYPADTKMSSTINLEEMSEEIRCIELPVIAASDIIDFTSSPDVLDYCTATAATYESAPIKSAVSALVYFSQLVFSEAIDRLDLVEHQDNYLELCRLPRSWEIAKAFPEDVVLVALTYHRRKRYCAAINTLVYCISPCLKADSHESIFLDRLEPFSEPSHQLTSHRDAVIYARRMLVDKCRWLFGESAQSTLEAQELLAGCLTRTHETEEAISLYRTASEEYRSLRMNGFFLAEWRCLSAIACILLRTNRHELAASMILRNVFTKHLKYIMDPATGRGRYLETFVDVVETLHASYLFSKDEKRGWDTISSIYTKMHDLVRSSSSGWMLGMFPEILYRSLELAKTYSAIKEFDNADPLFSLVLERLGSAGCLECCVPHVFASGYLWYGEHLLRNNRISAAARYLILARDVLFKNNLIWIGLEERIQAPWDLIIQRLEEESTEENQVFLSEMRGLDDPAKPKRLRLKRDVRQCPKHSEPGDQEICEIEVDERWCYGMDVESAKLNKNYNFIVQYCQSPQRNVTTGVNLGEFVPPRPYIWPWTALLSTR